MKKILLTAVVMLASVASYAQQAVFVAFTVVIITGLMIAVIYVIVRYARKFKESRDDNGDEVEFIGTGRHERKIRRSKRAVEKTNLAVNMQYRKAFKKAAMPDKRKEKMAVNSLAYMQVKEVYIQYFVVRQQLDLELKTY